MRYTSPPLSFSPGFSRSQTPVHDKDPFQPVAAIVAFLFPGAGHFYLGHTDRALRIAAGVLFLFLSGIFVGGISCVDRRENAIWFLGQALNGPIAFAADTIHTRFFKVVDGPASASGGGRVLRSPRPTEYRDPKSAMPIAITVDAQGKPSVTLLDGTTVSPAYPPYVKGVGRMNELGTLFTTIAGFMNLICIIDAAFTRRKEPAPGTVVGKL